jgi:uncharacterized membrane protein YkvA (DUF1232 family)
LAIVFAWIVLAGLLLVARAPGQSLKDLAKIFPNTLRLVRSLYRDPATPRSARWRLRLALIYNVQPINIIPDFVPVIGFADNVAILLWALRSTIRVAGADTVARHWPGGRTELGVLYRAAHIRPVDEEAAGGRTTEAAAVSEVVAEVNAEAEEPAFEEGPAAQAVARGTTVEAPELSAEEPVVERAARRGPRAS